MSDQSNQQPSSHQEPSSRTNYWEGKLPPPSPQSNCLTLLVVIGFIAGVIVLCSVIFNLASAPNQQTASNSSSTQATQPPQSSAMPTTKPTATPTQAPTATPIPTETQAQQEADYKASTTSTTVTNLDKDGNADQGKDVHFICKIIAFVKDSSGNTAGANVAEQDYSSNSIIQVQFTPNTDITQINQGDTLEVWGSDEGVFSGTNAYGATVQEVGISAQYMTDQTTGYQANS